MARCFLTGVEFRVEEGRVLNRTDAHRLLRTLRKRSESLDRLLVQLSPFDDQAAEDTRPTARARGKQHRMICKAVADALALAYPEIELFLSWPALLARNLRDRMRLLQEHPLYGAAISGVPGEELVPLAKLGQQVVRLIDPRHELSPRARLAITAGICVLHRAESANDIAASIRSVISGHGDLTVVGVPEEEHEAVRSDLMRAVGTLPRNPSSNEAR